MRKLSGNRWSLLLLPLAIVAVITGSVVALVGSFPKVVTGTAQIQPEPGPPTEKPPTPQGGGRSHKQHYLPQAPKVSAAASVLSDPPTYDQWCGSQSKLGSGASPEARRQLIELILGPTPNGSPPPGGVLAGCAGAVGAVKDGLGAVYYQGGYLHDGSLASLAISDGVRSVLLLGNRAKLAFDIVDDGIALRPIAGTIPVHGGKITALQAEGGDYLLLTAPSYLQNGDAGDRDVLLDPKQAGAFVAAVSLSNSWLWPLGRVMPVFSTKGTDWELTSPGGVSFSVRVTQVESGQLRIQLGLQTAQISTTSQLDDNGLAVLTGH